MDNRIVIDGVDAAYGSVRVLEGVSLEVRGGETVVLLGTNGNGKSTLMKSIMGMVPPRAGRITVHHPEALSHADVLFWTPEPLWCGTYF